MRRITALVFTLLFSIGITYSQNAIFLHHSTGGAVYSEGNVEGWISNYNTAHGTSYSITERAYPNSPYPWDNYPYDFWNLWANGNCDSDQSGIECLETLTQHYNLIIFKHCFPGAGIEADLGTPDASSGRKSLENYKAQYRALRSVMDSYPDNLFMVWTLAPLHRNATNSEDAARARQFVDWVKSTWLIEDGNPHPNIYLFDFFDIVAESNPHPSNGQVNCLRYDYEGDHNVSDSHPNYAANQTAGPQFAEAVVNCLEGISSIQVESIEITTESGLNTISSNGGYLQLNATVLPENASNKNITWSVIDGGEFAEISSEGELHALRNGTVRAQAAANDGSGITNTIDITITHQNIYVESLEIRSTEGTNQINANHGMLHLYAFSLPEAVQYDNVFWSIVYGAENISISGTGVVTALSNGTAQVMASDKNGSGIQAFFDIFVSNQLNPIESIEIKTAGDVTVIDTEGGSLQLTANVLPHNATGYVVWSIIEGNKLAYITPDGLLHAIRNGKVKVQALSSDNPDVNSSIEITITNQPVYVGSLEIRSEENTNVINTDNGTLHLYGYTIQEEVRYDNVTWSVISGADIISISESGVVTALVDGFAQVMATDKTFSGIQTIFDIFVSNQLNPIESIEIKTAGDVTTIDTEGGSLQLTAHVLPANFTGYFVWTITEGIEMAYITPDGLLHAIRNGKVKVQALSSDNPDVNTSIEITITNQPVFVESLEIRSEENTNVINTDNGTLHLYGYSMPEEVRYDNVTWSVISGADIISISESGVVTALVDGFAQVMATDKTFSGIQTIFDIFVSNQLNPIESIEIKTAGDVTVIDTEGGSLQLTAHVLPVNFTGYFVWTITEGIEMAYITPDGLLHAIRNGKVKVQALSSDNPDVNTSIEITITNQPVYVESLEIRSEENTNVINTDNGTLHLYGYSMPEEVRYYNITWSVISGADIISISESGVVTALSDGIAQILATDKAFSGIQTIFDIFVSNQLNPIESIEIKTAGDVTVIDTEGGSLQLIANVLPANFTGYFVWTITEGIELAYITPDGLLHAIRNGKVKVQALSSDNPDVNTSIEITITNQSVFVESLEIRSEENTNIINTDNGTLHLYGYSMPEEVRYDNVTWTIISGAEYISITETGLVTALANGNTSIMATTNDGFGIHAYFEIIVSNQNIKIESVEIKTDENRSIIDVKGGSIQLLVTVLPENATLKNITWSIVSGSEFGILTSDGLLTATNDGTIVVKATATDGSDKSDTYSVVITNQHTSVNELVKSKMKITFNQNTGNYMVHFGDDNTATNLKLYSIAGQLIWSGKGPANSFMLPQQKPGVYLLNVTKGDRRFAEKLVY